jgi:predicted secreted hydrolase
MRRIGIAFTALACLVLAAGSSPADDGWREITGPPELDFPRDHGAHPDTRTEWWYVTGLVADETGRRWGFQITFFRQGLEPGDPPKETSRLRARQIAAAHLAVADIQRGEFHHAERLRRSGGGLAGWSTEDLEVWLDDWEMRRADSGVISIDARDRETGIGLDLELEPLRPFVLQGDRGYSQKGADPGNASAYITWTRLGVSGSIEVGGRTVGVDGAAWFDHEWGTSQLGEGVAGWDWFSLRLDDGRDLMVYRLRRADGTPDPYSSGTVVRPDGSTTTLARDDVAIEPLDWWTSPATGGRYPVRWRLRVPAHDIDLEVEGLLPASELDGSATTGVVYWEGPVEATGSATGEGYVELTGYAGSLEGRF